MKIMVLQFFSYWFYLGEILVKSYIKDTRFLFKNFTRFLRPSRGVFRTQSDNYGGMFLQNC